MARQAQSFFKDLIPVHRSLQDDIAERIESEKWAKESVSAKLSEMGRGLSEDNFEFYAHSAATVYTLKTLFVKVAEDKRFMRRTHVHKIRQRNWVTVYHELFDSIAKNMMWGEYLEYAFRDIAYRKIAFDLFKETDYELVPPSDKLTLKLLETVDSLGDLSDIDTALIGDLYEHLMDETERKRLGYYTTPDFIIEFLLDRTLSPAFDDWHYSDIRYLDPACGTGHFLVRAYRRFLEKYREDKPEMTELELFKLVMENNIFGIDKSEFAAKITLFRLMLEGLDAKIRDAKNGDKQDFPDISFNVFVANSLVSLPTEERILPGTYEPLKYKTDPQARYYKKEISHLKVDLADVLSHRFHVINANPPYVRVQRNTEDINVPVANKKDRTWDWKQMDYLEYLRENYDSAYYNFDLSVPFLERSINLLTHDGDGGYLGFITTGKFAKQKYGKKLVEVLSENAKLEFVADLTDAKVFEAGAYPMLLVLRRGVDSKSDAEVETLATYQPKDDRDETWEHIKSIIEQDADTHFDDYVGLYSEEQEHFKKHPWTFRRSERDILSKINKASDKTLGDIAESIGLDFISAADPIFTQFITESFIRRNKLERDILIPCLLGASVRNWTVDWHGNRKKDSTCTIYTLDSVGEPIDISDFPNIEKFLQLHKEALEARADGWKRKPISETDTPWHIVFKRLYQIHTPKIIFPRTAMDAHFFLDNIGKYIAKDSCQVMYLAKMEQGERKNLLAILNSSLCNCFIKSISNKLPGSTEKKARFDWSKKFIGKLPIVQPEGKSREQLLSLVDEMLFRADRAMELSMYNLVRKEEYSNVLKLVKLRQAYIDEYRSVQARMKDIQNEIGHLVYKIYGITDPEDIAELEQPLYKRPWSEPDWDKEFEFEARDYINDQIEEFFARQQYPNELPMNIQDIGSELAANPKAEALRGMYYHGEPRSMADFAKECMDTDCRTIPFDEDDVKVGRGKKEVDILHERFFRFDEIDKELYGWTGWSPEGQLNVFLRLAQQAESEGKNPEPFKKWIESRVLRDIEDERIKEQTMTYLKSLR